MIAIIDGVGSTALRACADIGHARLLPGGVTAFVTALGNRIDYVQLTDNDGVVDQHLPLGAGTVDIAEMTAALQSVGHRGPVVVELDDESARRVSIATLRAY